MRRHTFRSLPGFALCTSSRNTNNPGATTFHHGGSSFCTLGRTPISMFAKVFESTNSPFYFLSRATSYRIQCNVWLSAHLREQVNETSIAIQDPHALIQNSIVRCREQHCCSHPRFPVCHCTSMYIKFDFMQMLLSLNFLVCN